MISGYTRPQLLIKQVLDILPNQEARTLHAFTVGPQFNLHRYTNAAERAAMNGVVFAENTDTDPNARQLIPYEGINASEIVDAAFNRVYGEKLEGQLWAAESSVNDSDANLFDFVIQSLSHPNRLRIVRRQAVITATNGSNGGLNSIMSASLVFGGSGYAASATIDQPVVGGTGTGAIIRMTTNLSGVVTAVTVVAPGSGYTAPVTFSATAPNSGANVGHTPDSTYPTPLIADLYDRPLKAGDILYTTRNGITVRRTIGSVEQELVAAHYGVDADKSNKRFAASALNPSRTDGAVFGNGSAPANWGIELAKGTVLAVNVTAGGSGFTSTPDVVFSDPIAINGALVWPAEEAIASAVINTSGVVTGVTVDVPGAGFYVGGLVGYTIVTGGTGYDAANPPRITVTTPSGGEAATLEAVISGGAITGIKILDPGYGYTTHVGNVTYTGLALTGGAGSGAQIIMVANLGSIRGFNMQSAGSGYVDAVTLGGPTGGSAFAASGYLGFVSAPAVATAGTGYAVGDIAELDTGTAYLSRKARVRVTAVGGGGTVTAVEVVSGYEGWYSASFPVSSTESTTAITGSGDNALELDCTDGLGLTLIRITNPGAGYTTDTFSISSATPPTTPATGLWDLVSPPSVTISGGGGTGATATLTLRSVAGSWNGLVEGSTYDGKYGERYTITVTHTGSGIDDALVRIRSSSGAFAANSVPAKHYGLDYVIDHPALGGLAVSLRPASAATALRLGDTFAFTVTGAYLPLELAAGGQLLALNIIAAGSGYTAGTYDLTIAAPPAGGTQASAWVTVGGGGTVTGLNINNPGAGYLSAPVISMPAGAGAGTGAVIQAVLTTPEDSRDLTVVQSGVYSGPKNTRYQIKVVRGSSLGQATESFTDATVRVSDSAGIDEIQEYTVAQGVQYALGSYGLSFVFPSNQATPSGTAGASTATATATQSGGVITKIDVTSQGSGYTTPPNVVIAGGGGSGATAVAILHQGKVVEIVVTAGGTGYSGPTAVIADPTAYQGGLRTGDTYYIDAVAEANSGPHSQIVLNGQVTDITGWTELDVPLNKFDVDFRVLYTGIISPRRNNAPELAWESGTTEDGGIFLEAGLSLEVTERSSGNTWVPVKNATNSKLFAHYRSLVPANSGDTISRWSSETDIVAKFGANDPDNPAAYGAIVALNGGQGKPVYIARLETNDLAGHQKVIRKAEHIEGIYAVCPLTYDQPIKDAWKAHVTKMSQANFKLWRRAYFGIQNPGAYSLIALKDDGTNFEASVTTNASGNVRVISEDGDFLTKNVKPGDLFRTNFSTDAWGDLSYEEYPVRTVSTEDELILETGPASPIDPAIKFEIWRPDNGQSQADYVGANSDFINNRRAANVWSDTPNKTGADNVLRATPVYYLAAEIAGLRAAVLPQQGLTYTELSNSVDGAPLMFSKYVEEELNTAAALGTFIVTQDQEDGPIYIRHQLTTDTNHGILYYEDSIGTNLDNVAYAVKDIFQPYIGKRNINVETLEEMETKMRDLLNTFLKNPGGFSNIGPALISWSNLKIEIDATFKDRVNVEVTLELPLPINTISVTLRATAASDATVTAINFTVNSLAAAA